MRIKGNVFPKQIRGFGNGTFQSEMSAIMVQFQQVQLDKHFDVLWWSLQQERDTQLVLVTQSLAVLFFYTAQQV